MTQLEQYRHGIDRLYGQLTQLFCRKMEITGRVGEYQRERFLLAAKAA